LEKARELQFQTNAFTMTLLSPKPKRESDANFWTASIKQPRRVK